MKKQDAFRKSLFQIALPVTVQSLLQSSFSVVVQLMTGQVGRSFYLNLIIALIIAVVFGTAVTTILSTFLRCMDAAVQPLYASIAAAVVNTGLNYILIFGKLGFPAMGTWGAALATVISQVCGCAITLIMFWRLRAKRRWNMPFSLQMGRSGWKQYAGIMAGKSLGAGEYQRARQESKKLMLSLEECVRLLISLVIFRRNSWMRSLGGEYR